MFRYFLRRLALGMTGMVLFSFFPTGAVEALTNAISAREFKAILDQRHNDLNVVLLDIRTPKEFSDGHIAGAVNLDYYSRDYLNRLKSLDRNKDYLIYCRSGNRTGKSLAIFKKLGFARVRHLETGIVGWVREGYPLVQRSG